TRGNPNGHAMTALIVAVLGLECGLDVAAVQRAVAAELDRRRSGHRQRQRFERVAGFDWRENQCAAVILDRAAQRQRDRLALFDDAGGLVVAGAFPRDPDADRGHNQRRDGDEFAKIDPAALFGFVHRPPASSKLLGAASSQLAAMRSPTWSQSTASPAR